MAYGPADWIAFALFLLLAVTAVILEAMWLSRRGWATSGKAVAYVLLTDVIGITIGLFTFFAAFGVLIMMSYGGSGLGGASADAGYWAVTAFGLLFPPIFLLSLKRLFLLVFGIRTSRSAWLYSISVTALIGMGVFLPPVLLFWLIK